ncbi:MAG: response regulator transcription factor [Patescibacteria group bacterium]
MPENLSVKKALVLMNESDPVLARVCKNKFSKEKGWEASLSTTYDQAVDLIEAGKIDVVLTEIVLHDSAKNGFDLLQFIRSSDNADIAGMPVIIFTDLSQDSDRQRATELGATDYLVKSEVMINEVIDRLQSIIENN